ncbi:uncharacterized protein FA14DRAFT_46057 [Meira miltonrushii]|uniref:Uncharacterized protein n=1 Tax=Meira miltonrushii TaxID=1280837 RepID=A0A316VDT7_9BASI|nr:uncharacterized protein FA14DRAFT_46057 [Meira miltonrushii]PWN35716.1 hypothetical protein FA14DRAFT_46057 [Meira miltonrushii]
MSDSKPDPSQNVKENKIQQLKHYSGHAEWEKSLLNHLRSLGPKHEGLLKGTFKEPKKPDPIEIPESFLDEFPPTDSKHRDEFNERYLGLAPTVEQFTEDWHGYLDAFNEKYWSFFATVHRYEKEWNRYLDERLDWEIINVEVSLIINSSLSLSYSAIFSDEQDAYRKFCRISEHSNEVMTQEYISEVKTYLEDEIFSKVLAKPFKGTST